MTSLLKAYLVDMDGTLCDTSQANYQAYARALEEAGIVVDRTTFDREAFGRNWRQFLPPWLARQYPGEDAAATGERARLVAQRKAALYREALVHARFNEALACLLKHRAEGVRVALVTTASAANVDSVLAMRPDIRQLFDLVVTGDDVDKHKPDPMAYRLAAEKLGVLPQECLVIEDSDIGIDAGRAFGAEVLRISMQLPERFVQNHGGNSP